MIKEMKIALRNAGKINPNSIDDYINADGYQALKMARQMDKAQLISTLEDAGKLRGRGGAGFNTGLKWSSAFKAEGCEKYVVCNADEGEPGTYKDRTIIENDPHTVIEGVLICAYAIGAKECYIYCRGEYEHSISLLRNAIAQAKEKGISAEVKVRVHSGAGSYVCGEETALLNSLEGKRAEPRLKPPFPTTAGFRAKPTVVNNVETFAAVPAIVEKGAEWFRAIGSPEYPGTKVFSLSGDIVHKACFEAPTNVTLRDVIFGFGGGVANGCKLKAIQVGGSSCGFLTPDKLDTSVDFDSMRAIGRALGSGAILVIDDSHNIVDILVGIAEFFNHESCGKCAPCREGTLRAAQLIRNIADGKGSKKDLEQIKDLSEMMGMSCFCPLGQSATAAVTSAMELFPEDFRAKISKQEV
ncbi:complex I 51 kDa subunit family protein [Sporomusa acidovorans]|uniref:NADP-reducing hydrogenase subunit HndC n=1 Tax=Sporomusa acidovorans (strain ATCC 49682 / DSM 3132 / Mol) TaxID=1123286 RepID=A0ABZ3J012_SPOA4|nr:NADH-ubiquinone oxidoreductase-F iron-sulfur binding region domain-containing protein [Sporomusa acidovorans]OZC13366.1 NADP-reducing hydrogenase subunit HndC [Sporomusa acidovorans DSM 3132]SDF53246.1 NADH dehydrogenase subunit F [Sporomusa acidovorans]